MVQAYRMLVVDDDEGLREYLQALASSRGFQVFAAPTGEDAIETLEQSRPDLVTLDLVLPGMDGLETLKRLKDRLPEVPVIMITAYGDADTKRTALENGAETLFTKPIDFGALRSEIDMRVERAA